jgi:hypothetical protein
MMFAGLCCYVREPRRGVFGYRRLPWVSVRLPEGVPRKDE